MLCLSSQPPADSPQWEAELFKILETGGFVIPPEMMRPLTMASLPGPVSKPAATAGSFIIHRLDFSMTLPNLPVILYYLDTMLLPFSRELSREKK